MHRRVHGPPAFRMLVRTYPSGTDPSASPPVLPTPLRNTVMSGPIHFNGNAQIQIGRFEVDPGGPPPIAPEFGRVVVDNNDFSTGRAVILLGNYKLISNIDFIPGAGVNATAVALAAAINNLPGYIGTPIGAAVQIDYHSGPSDQITWGVRHYGSITNFTPVIPATGEMAVGWPRVGPPLLT